MHPTLWVSCYEEQDSSLITCLAFLYFGKGCYKQKHLKCVRVQNGSLGMRRQRNSSSAQSFAAVSLVVQQLYSIDDLLGGELKGIIAPLYLLAVLPCQGAGQELSMVARPMGAGAWPARTLSHCTWVRQVGQAQGWQMGSAQGRDHHTSLWWWCKSESSH